MDGDRSKAQPQEAALRARKFEQYPVLGLVSCDMQRKMA